MPWLVCGDFNEVLYHYEMFGGLDKPNMSKFHEALRNCHPIDIGFLRENFIPGLINERARIL